MTTPTKRSIYQPQTRVYETESGHVAIQQEQPMDDDTVIILDVLFIPILIEWLQEVAEEVKQDQSNN